MTRSARVRQPWALVAVFAVLCAGCGGGEDGSPSPESQAAAAAVAVDASQTYRDDVTAVVRVTDDARSSFRGEPHGESMVTSARQLVRTTRAAAGDIDELTPPAALTELDRDLAQSYRRWAAALDEELRRRPISMARLADVVREYGKATDQAYEQILIAP